MKQKLIMWLISTIITPANIEFVADMFIDLLENYAYKNKKMRIIKGCKAFREAFHIEDND